MKASDWLQFVSVGAVLVALLLNIWQNRESSRQTVAAARQAATATDAVKQASVQHLTSFSADFRAFVEAGPDLLAWFLDSRGIPVGTHEQNLRYMFVFARMDLHEATFVSYSAGQLDQDFWLVWRNTIAADAGTAEFRAVWSAVENLFTPAFGDMINSIIVEQDPSSDSLSLDAQL